MAKLILLISIIFFDQNLFAQNIACNKSNISFVEASISARHPEFGTFRYYYQYIKKADDSIPTVIVIPGGPGGSAINLQTENPYFDWTQILYGFVQKYNAILTDPRSIGCNQGNTNFPIESFSSENVANDIISIIKSLKLHNYVIYGHSFGTVVATRIGKRVSDGAIPPPKAIILSGTLGNYFKNHKSEVTPYYYQAWGNVRSHLPEGIQKQFPKNNEWSDYPESTDTVLPLGIPLRTWFNFVFSNLTEGGVYQNGKLVNPFLDKLLLIESPDGTAVQKLKDEVSSYSPKADSSTPSIILRPFHDSIWCQELEENQSSECLAQNFTFTNPYDSKLFQIENIPIIYIHGEFDTSVPMEKAIYHYLNQLGENKFFLVAKDGGHATTMSISDCRDLFWRAVFDSAVDLQNAIKSCVGIKMIVPK